MNTNAIWDDDRDSGGEKSYESGVKDLQESVKVIEVREWLHREEGSAAGCAQKPHERRAAEHSYLLQREARLPKAENKSS